jgi:hypothetical protein
MNAADAAGGKNFDSGSMRNPHRRRHSRRPIPAPRDCDSNVPRAQFLHIVVIGDALALRLIEAHVQLSGEHCYGCRRRALSSDDLFDGDGGFEVLRPRQSVRDDRRFERNECLILFKGRFSFVTCLRTRLHGLFEKYAT